MADNPGVGAGQLYWAIGQYDARTDHSDDNRDRAKILAMLVFMLIVLSYIISPEGDEWKKIVALWLGMWLLVAIVFLAWYITLSLNRYDVFTLVDLPPYKTRDRLDRALEGGVTKLSRADRVPWLHGEMARFKVTMDLEEEAVLVVKPYGQSHEGPTYIHVRSSRNRDEWRDLRRLVDDAFRDVAVPGPPEGIEGLDGDDVPGDPRGLDGSRRGPTA